MNFLNKYKPTKIDDLLGQKHLFSKNSALYKLVKAKEFNHSFFYGPAGVGKTASAKVIANELELPFYELDATSFAVKDLRSILNSNKNALLKPLIFIDEVHRLSKTQQEVLLLPMHNYEAIIIGASTINPYYSLSSGIRSRSLLFEFKSLGSEDLKTICQKVLDQENIKIQEDAKQYLIDSSSGDIRAMLNLLNTVSKIEENISLKTLKELRANKLGTGVSEDDTHYDLISAFIKSIRGSDADAGIYYLARMIEAGESADFIARRLVILASEDIGNANPNALNLANSTLQSVGTIGFPEARIILAQCVIYLCHSPKSNSSYNAINEAITYVKNNQESKIPPHIKPKSKEYKYPHDFGGYVDQVYMQKNTKFYESSSIGFEKTMDDWISKVKKIVD